MRRDLAEPISAPDWPDGVSLAVFTPELAAEAHALLRRAFAGSAETVLPFDDWWRRVSTDPEFEPSLCFVVVDAAGRLVAVAQCWTSAFIKDLAVDPDWRRRGLALALLNHVFAAFAARGATAVELKVDRANPTGAIRVYRRAGMLDVAE